MSTHVRSKNPNVLQSNVALLKHMYCNFQTNGGGFRRARLLNMSEYRRVILLKLQ